MNHNFYACLISYHFSYGFFGVDLAVWDLFISLMILTLVVWYVLGFMIFRSGFCFWGFIYVWHFDICVMKLLYTSLWFPFLFFFSGLLFSFFFISVFLCDIYNIFFFGAKNDRNFDWYYGIIQVKTELRATQLGGTPAQQSDIPRKRERRNWIRPKEHETRQQLPSSYQIRLVLPSCFGSFLIIH